MREKNTMEDEVCEDFESGYRSECSDGSRYYDASLEQSNTEVREGDRILLRGKQMSFRLV
jgi:hypothetical protein